MSQLNELITTWENASREELVNVAKEAIAVLTPICQKLDPEHDGQYMLQVLVITASFIDQEINDAEYQLIAELTGLDQDGIHKAVTTYEEEGYTLPEDADPETAEAFQGAMLALFIAFAAIDGKVVETEKEFFKDFIQ